MMNVKDGVVLSGIKTPILKILPVLDEIFAVQGFVFTITSALEGKHSKNSLHYKGLAIDVRTWEIPPAELKKLVAIIQARIGFNYDVVIEKTHLHIEFDPKGKPHETGI